MGKRVPNQGCMPVQIGSYAQSHFLREARARGLPFDHGVAETFEIRKLSFDSGAIPRAKFVRFSEGVHAGPTCPVLTFK